LPASKRLRVAWSTVFARANFAAKVDLEELIVGLSMGRAWVLGTALTVAMGSGLAIVADHAEAMGFCNCCNSSPTQSCGKICASTNLTPAMCPVIVDYETSAAQDANPLNGLSLRDITLGEPTPWRLELFRRFVENGRRQAVRSYKKAMRDERHHRNNGADYKKADALYKEALVNYYHGIRAYLNRVGTKSD